MATSLSFPRILGFVEQVDARYEMHRIGVSSAGMKLMQPKSQFLVIRIDQVPSQSATILKQEMLSLGGEAALSFDAAYRASKKKTAVLLLGTVKTFQHLIPKLAVQPFASLQLLAKNVPLVLSHYLSGPAATMIGKQKFDWSKKTYVMGVINATFDSFSRDGIGTDIKKGIQRALAMEQAGAAMIDVGGQSTRRFSLYYKVKTQEITEAEEIQRVIPLIKALKKELNIPISIDTYRASVAEKALAAGASCVNDVWGLQKDKQLINVVKEHQVPVVIMHNQKKAVYQDVRQEVFNFLYQTTERALEVGIKRENIVIDPGIGFAKTTEQSLELLKHLRELKSLGYPLLVGTSRKSVVGQVLNVPAEERLSGSLATYAVAVLQGANIVRVHDVKEAVEVVRIVDAVRKA